MHERSLVSSLLRQVDQIVREHDAHSVSEVRIEVGPLSGVETPLLESAFEQLAIDDFVASSQLVIDQVPLVGRCLACDVDHEIQKFDFRCQRCGGNVSIVRGDTVQLVSVTLETDEPAETATP